MPLEKVAGGWRIRLRYGVGLRGRFLIVAKNQAAAEAKAERMARMAADLAACGKSVEAKAVLDEAGLQETEKGLLQVEEVVRELCAEAPTAPGASPRAVTFRDVAEMWFSGEIHRRFPQRVKERTPGTVTKDRQKLMVIAPAIGNKPVASITLADARAAMALVPADISQGTRCLYEGFIYRVMKHARRLELIETSPIPSEFVSPQGDPPLFQYLRPDEELKLLTCKEIPLETRLAYGLMTREGLRTGGITIMRWSHIDLESGLFSHKHKTKRPRRWRLSPDVLRTLQAWRKRYADSELVFPEFDNRNAGTALRRHLIKAGVTRPALHQRTEDERPMRAHDLRATFVTLALANGRDDRWIQDRTGHADAATMNLYRRMAREAEDLHLTWLSRLDDAIGPELGLGQRVGQPRIMSGESSEIGGSYYSDIEQQESPLEPKTASSSQSGSTDQPPGPAGLLGVGQESTVEVALAYALKAAIDAQQWQVAQTIVQELGERRRVREQPDVPSLDAARKRKREEGAK